MQVEGHFLPPHQLDFQNLDVGRAVFDEQHFGKPTGTFARLFRRLGARRNGRCGRRRGPRRSKRYFDDEGGAGPLLRFAPDRAAMQLRDAAADGKSKPGALDAAADQPLERLEDQLAVLGIDARPVVTHRQPAGIPLRFARDRHLRSFLVAIAYGIRHQVLQKLGQQRRIAHDLRQRPANDHRLAALHLLAQIVLHLVEHIRQRDRRQRRPAIGFELGEAGDLDDQVFHMVGGAEHIIEQLPVFGRKCCGTVQDAAEGFDRPQRLLQIMGHGAREDLERLPLLLQLCFQHAVHDGVLDAAVQRFGRQRILGEIVARAGLHHFDGNRLAALAGQHDDIGGRIVLQYIGKHAEPVAPGERIVEQDAVRPLAPVQRAPLFAGLRLDDGIGGAGDAAQYAAIDFAIVDIVVDDENAAVVRQTVNPRAAGSRFRTSIPSAAGSRRRGRRDRPASAHRYWRRAHSSLRCRARRRRSSGSPPGSCASRHST
ncbi:hypothetical protein RHECNPAF_2940013 [Rhizobium etli CNPAF512]|nr:hypothetical protein RHECNPAF_2940013 [Rhizobium etli CNPAF512]